MSCVNYLTTIPAQISVSSLWSRPVMIGSAERRKPTLNSHSIPTYLNVRDRQLAIATASRSNKL